MVAAGRPCALPGALVQTLGGNPPHPTSPPRGSRIGQPLGGCRRREAPSVRADLYCGGGIPLAPWADTEDLQQVVVDGVVGVARELGDELVDRAEGERHRGAAFGADEVVPVPRQA